MRYNPFDLSIRQVDELIRQSRREALKTYCYDLDSKSYTALMIASLRAQSAVATYILDRASEVGRRFLGEILNQRDNNGQSSLLLASTKGHCTLVDLLLKRGALIDQQDGEGQSALMLSSGAGHEDTTTLLLEKKAQVDLQDQKGYSALMHAVKNAQCKTTKLLLDNGADIDQQSMAFECVLSILHTPSNIIYPI